MYGTDILTKTYKAEHDVTQYAVVGAGNADFTVDMPAAAGELPIGVALEDATADHDVAIRQIGIAECVASDVIARFTKVSIADTDGKIRVAVAGDYILGFTLAAAAEDGDIVPVFLTLNSDYDAVDAEGITLAHMADLARGSLISGQTAGNRPTALDAKGDGKILVGDGNDLKSVAVSGDVTLANTGAVTLAAAVSALMQGAPTFTIGEEANDVINVAVQLKDAAGTAIASKHSVNVWLSDTAGGAECAAAPSGTVVIGTDGVIIASHTAKLNHQIVTGADGKFDLNITEAGEKTLYVNVEYQGKVYSSGAVTFAA